MRPLYVLIPLGLVVLLTLAFYNSDLRQTMERPIVNVATTGPDQPAKAYEAARKAAAARMKGEEVSFPTAAEGADLARERGNGLYTVSAWAHRENGAGVGTYLTWSANVRCEGARCQASRVQVRN